MMIDMSKASGRPTRRRQALILMSALSILLLVGVLAASCGDGTGGGLYGGGGSGGTTTSTPASSDGEGGVQVVMKNMAFDPDKVTIKAGESVTWTNQDSANHTVTADNGEFESGDLGKSATFTFQFDKAGTYPYHCGIHPSMTGTVVVE